MDERGIIKNFQHEFISIFTVLFQDVLWTCYTFLKGSTVEEMGLEIWHVASDVMRQLAQICGFEFVAVFICPDVVFERVMDEWNVQFWGVGGS